MSDHLHTKKPGIAGLFIALCSLLAACSKIDTAPATCEQQSDIQPVQITQVLTRAACLTRLNDQLLVIKIKGKPGYQLPSTAVATAESLPCTAHRSLWQQTQLNALVGQHLGQINSQTAVFICDISHSFDTPFTDFPIPNDQSQIEQITMLNPYELSDKQWHNRNEFVQVLDLFNLSSM